MTPLHIAIDGPVGAGKSDISSRLAKKLGIVYLYTGAMYRAIALACKKEGISFKDTAKITQILDKYSLEIVENDKNSQRSYILLLNGIDVTDQLFTPVMDQGSSDVGTIPQVRKHLVTIQKKLASGKSVVMEGRDITIRVLPNAQLKIYLNASVNERVKRRLLMQKSKGVNKSYQEVLEDTLKRDKQDQTRTVDPLKKTSDAWELDTTNKTQEMVVNAIVQKLKKMKLI